MAETLQTLRLAAKAWREGATRGKRRRLSDDLKRRAVDLLERHAAAEIAAAVGVSDRKLVETWRAQFDAHRRSRPPDSPFIEVSTSSMMTPPVGGCGNEQRLELRGTGVSLVLEGKFGVEIVRALAEVVVRGGTAGATA